MGLIMGQRYNFFSKRPISHIEKPVPIFRLFLQNIALQEERRIDLSRQDNAVMYDVAFSNSR